MTWWEGGISVAPFAGAAPLPTAGTYINNTDADLYYSYSVAWSTWIPTRTNITVGDGTEYCRSWSIGGRMHHVYSLTVGSTTTIGTLPKVRNAVHTLRMRLLPVTVACFDVSASRWYPVAGFGDSSDGATFNVSATFPFTWAAGDVLSAMWTATKDPPATSVGVA